MKPGDKVKIRNLKNDAFVIATVVKVTEETVMYKHPAISGTFGVSRHLVDPI